MGSPAARGRRALWWACGGLLLLFVGLIAYQVHVRRTRFTSDPDELLLVGAMTFGPADNRPLDAKLWPQWRGLRRDGVTTAPDLLVQWPSSGPAELWRVEGGDGYSSFALSGDLAFSMAALPHEREGVMAWDLRSGKVRWRHVYDRSKSFDYGGPRATPTLADGLLYTVSPAGRLLCLQASTGEPRWQIDLVEKLGGQPPRWGFSFSPLVEDGLVYALPGGRAGRGLAAFDARTGELAWASQNDPAGYSSPLAVTIGGVRQVVFFTGRRLLGVTPKEGELLWEFPWETQHDVNAATPVAIRARAGTREEVYLFISSGYSKGCALLRVAAEDGRFAAKLVYESNELCCHFASPVLHGDCLYALDETRDLTCLDVRTGAVRWRKGDARFRKKSALRGGFQKGSLIRVDDRLLVLGEDGRLGLVECDPEGYRETALARPLRGRCWTQPVLADGRLLLRNQSEVVCLDLRKR